MSAKQQSDIRIESIQLVNRDDQIYQFKEALSRIRRRQPVRANLLEWYGGPGIGKTTLVKALLSECSEDQVASVLVDFSRPKTSSDECLDDPARLVEDIAAGLGLETARTLRERIAAYRASEPPQPVVRAFFRLDRDQREKRRLSPAWLNAWRDVAEEFAELVAELAEAGDQDQGVQPVVIFFDETELADPELVDWIEEWIIRRVVPMKHTVVVWTARRPWRWKRPEIRRRLQSEQLKPFDEEDVRRQFSDSALAEQFFRKVHGVTGGHPFANTVVISQLDGWKAEGRPLTEETFDRRQGDILGEIFNQLIEDYAFRGLSAHLKTACKLLAMTRMFDRKMLREVLVAYDSQEFGLWEHRRFDGMMQDLKETQLLIWDKGYAIDDDLRYIIQRYMLSCEPSTYVAMNETALRVYREWLERPVDNRGLFIVEELYHCACLGHAGDKVDLEEVLAGRLEEYPNWIQDPQALHNALNRLEGELRHDSELAKLTDVSALARQVQDFSGDSR